MAASDAPSVPSSARIEALISALYDTPVRVRGVDRLEPWFVLRCHLTAQAPHVPASVVVKRLRDNPDDLRKDPAQLHTEQAALTFVAELDPALAPRLLVADTALTNPHGRILVLEDLAPRKPLREVLLGEGPERSARLLTSFARALGRLHAVSVGQADAYYSRRSQLGPVDRRADIERFLGDWRAGAQRMADAGVVMTTAALQELAGIVTELATPSAFLAFSNGDPGVNNYLVGADGDGRLIDFESAGFRHAICDLVNDLYIPGPMWLTVGDPLPKIFVVAGLTPTSTSKTSRITPLANEVDGRGRSRSQRNRYGVSPPLWSSWAVQVHGRGGEAVETEMNLPK